MSEEDNEEIITEEMLWERIPETNGIERANTYYELSARIYARGQYDEALALAESARDIYTEFGNNHANEELAQAYSAIGYNLNQLKRMDEAASAMSQAVDLLRKNKSPIALELACTLGEWWYSSKKYQEVVDTMNECAQEHLVLSMWSASRGLLFNALPIKLEEGCDVRRRQRRDHHRGNALGANS